MKTKDIIFDLLNYLEIYVADNEENEKELSTLDFIGFVNNHIEGQSLKRVAISGGQDDFLTEQFSDNKIATDVSILVTLLFRYAKSYIKKALKDSQINSADEFSFLITLLTYESASKQQLINIQVMEKTSGIEIINRLMKKGFISQFDDEQDRRSKRIKITPLGRLELISILPQMSLVSKVVVGNLTVKEQHTLLYLLRKLDDFHNDIFLNCKHIELEEIVKKTSISFNPK
ncbi:MAG: MarR family winged helix-turn-helix transcriptional regulator [Paludibacter sp.]|nr:MarR family winged helix-turn-helix transcriptional regulator [Paludibacter sp.]